VGSACASGIGTVVRGGPSSTKMLSIDGRNTVLTEAARAPFKISGSSCHQFLTESADQECVDRQHTEISKTKKRVGSWELQRPDLTYEFMQAQLDKITCFGADCAISLRVRCSNRLVPTLAKPPTGPD
jgi:hypothetical protein